MEVIKIITDYEKLCNSVTDLVDASGYKLDYVCNKLGFTRMGFYQKRKAGTFKPDELKKLFKIIDNGSLEDKLLGKIMEQADKSETLTEQETKDFFNKRKK